MKQNNTKRWDGNQFTNQTEKQYEASVKNVAKARRNKTTRKIAEDVYNKITSYWIEGVDMPEEYINKKDWIDKYAQSMIDGTYKFGGKN